MSTEAPSSSGPADTHIAAGRLLQPGSLILDGRFCITQLVGGGGMGLVYSAEQVSLGRRVAVKVLRNDLPIDANMGERFRREALLLSSVEHPSVVRLIDFGQTAVGPCLVMEYVEGETLEVLMARQGPLPVERVERLLTQLAQGLAAIHAKNIVHRDLKPENVVLTKTGGDLEEQARLLDFGIARLAEPEEDARVTAVGLVLGTPEYLAPEQALGQPIDARSDLYSLGIIAFRMLTGRHPFPGPSAREFVSQHIHQAAPSLVSVNPALKSHHSMVATVMGCLEKDPKRRPQSALEFLQRLKALDVPVTLSGAMRLGESTTDSISIQNMVPRNRVRFWVTVGVALLAAVILIAMWLSQPLRKTRRLVGAGRGSEALQIIEDSGDAEKSWPLKMLKAVALIQAGRQEEGLKLLEGVPETVDVEGEALEAMAEAFGRNETPRLRKLLAHFQKLKTLPALQKLAKADASYAQWGALRFVDTEYAGQGLPLAKLYEAALERKDCAIRRLSAKRLGELRAVESTDALKRLKGLPRKHGLLFDDECGQDAAAQALNRLAKEE